MFVLNPQSGQPIYRQLVEQITRLIVGGQLVPGAMLPSVREVALEHAVNPMTISKAYALLEAEGKHSMRQFAEAIGANPVKSARLSANINTPADLSELENRHGL